MTTALLSDKHLAMLEASAIAPDVWQERGVRSITGSEARRLGYSEQQARAGLLFPVHSPDGQQTLSQLRPDAPRTWTDDAGKVKTIKYETPSGSVMRLDVHPRVRPLLQDPSIPLIVTEGIRKGDSAVSAGLCCVALLGVWNWRRREKEGAPSLPLEDWKAIALSGRVVYICFDSDVMTKREVARALRDLRTFLKGEGADVGLIYLPDGENGEKVGLDDFRHAGHSAEELLALSSDKLRTRPDEDEESEGLRGLRKGDLGRRLKGVVAEIVPNGGLKFAAEVSPDAIFKAVKNVCFFYSKIDDAKRWDLIDAWLACKAFIPWGQEAYVREKLFGMWAKQLPNWLSAAGSFAVNAEGRRRPHLPFWVHAEVRKLTPDQQDAVFDTFEAQAIEGERPTQSDVREMVATITGEPAEEPKAKGERATPTSPPPSAWSACVNMFSGVSVADDLLRLGETCGPEGAAAIVHQALEKATAGAPWDGMNTEDTDEAPADEVTDEDDPEEPQEDEEEDPFAASEDDPDQCEESGDLLLKTGRQILSAAENWTPESETVSPPDHGHDGGLNTRGEESFSPPPPSSIHSLRIDTVKPATPKWFMLSAPAVARARTTAEEWTRGHEHCRRPEQDLGSAQKNAEVDLWGQMGEEGAKWALSLAGPAFPWCWRGDGPRVVPGPDLDIGAVRYDAKSVQPTHRYVCINEAKHRDPARRPDCYLIVRFHTPTEYSLHMVSAAEVDRWELRRDRQSPYLSALVETLPGVTDVWDLPGAMGPRSAAAGADDYDTDDCPELELVAGGVR